MPPTRKQKSKARKSREVEMRICSWTWNIRTGKYLSLREKILNLEIRPGGLKVRATMH